MTIEKLKSGSYRVTQVRHGVRFRVTFDHKPSKAEAEDAIHKKMLSSGEKPNGPLTFEEAAFAYVEMKRHVLSPNTVREYSCNAKRLSEWFLQMKVDEIDQIAINKQVNELAAKVSPKTVRNYHGFITAILGTFRPQMKVYTTLPQRRKTEPYIPTDDEVKRILAELQPSEYFCGIVLAAFGLRRGEICALLPDDVEKDGTVHVRRALAIDEHRQKVLKSTKTTESERDLIIPAEIAERIHSQGFVYRRKPGGLLEALHEVQDRLGIPRFPLHKLRHYFASKMLTITDAKTVQAMGGWKTDAVLKTVYAHAMRDEEDKAKRTAAEQLGQSIL